MNIYIAIFLAFGACFGLSTFSNRHLFSEGPRHADTDTSITQRILWTLVCAFLWPIMLASGLNSARILAQARKKPDT